MILDFERGVSLPDAVDVCIVGAGIAGLVVAAEMARKGCRVLILEGGGPKDEERSQSLYDCCSVGRPHQGTGSGRFRVLGGSSTRWGGQLLPLEPLDYAARADFRYSGWPIGPTVVNPFVDRAAAYLGVDRIVGGDEAAHRRERTVPAWDADRIQQRFSAWAPWRRRNIAKNLRSELRASPLLNLAIHANVVELLFDNVDVGRVKAVRIRGYDGREAVVSAASYVVAGGAVETARLILASTKQAPVLAANDSIGRYFIDHLSIRAARIEPASRKQFLRAFQPFFDGASLRTPKLQLAPSFQQQCSSLAAQGHVAFDLDPGSPLGLIRAGLQSRQRGGRASLTLDQLTAVGRALPDVIEGFGARVFLGVRPVPTRSTPFLQIDVEQQPRPDSRITLGADRDPLGMPKAVVDWQWGTEERAAARLCARTIVEEFERLSLGRMHWQLGFVDGADEAFDAAVRDIYHQAGTARMGTDSSTSVVDPDLRVHGTGNLYVSGCAVMPTIGCGNPTLTMMALCIRLAEHLETRLRDAA